MLQVVTRLREELEAEHNRTISETVERLTAQLTQQEASSQASLEMLKSELTTEHEKLEVKFTIYFERKALESLQN